MGNAQPAESFPGFIFKPLTGTLRLHLGDLLGEVGRCASRGLLQVGYPSGLNDFNMETQGQKTLEELSSLWCQCPEGGQLMEGSCCQSSPASRAPAGLVVLGRVIENISQHLGVRASHVTAFLSQCGTLCEALP